MTEKALERGRGAKVYIVFLNLEKRMTTLMKRLVKFAADVWAG